MKRLNISLIALFFSLSEVHSTDTWILKNFPDSVNISGLAINAANEIFVIASYQGDNGAWPVGVAYHSSDDGNIWTQIIPSGFFPEIKDILIDYEDDIYLGTWYGGLYKSEDNGATWEEKGNGMSNNMPVYLSINSVGVIYAGHFLGGGIDYSLNGGEEWHSTNHPTNTSIRGLGIGPDDYIFSDGGLYSPDGGESWHYNNAGLFGEVLINEVCYAFNNTSEVFLGTVNGVYYLSSIDASWENVFSINSSIRDIIVSSQNTVYAATHADVFYSPDNGQNWENINGQFTGSPPQRFCFDNEGFLWAASSHELYKSQHVVNGYHEDFANRENIRLFPNPFDDYLLINFTSNYQDGENISINIFSIDGKLQKSVTDKVINNQLLLNLKNLASGTYILRMGHRGFGIRNEIIIKE
jgi:hypothetical protein